MTKKHVFEIPANRRSDAFTLRISSRTGITPHTIGFIVSVKDPHSRIWYKFKEKTGEKFAKTGGHYKIFNTTYGSGTFHGYFLVLTKKQCWHKISFEIKVAKNPSKPGDLITNSYRTKAAGQTARGAHGLDVAFSISSGRTLKNIRWVFGDEKPPVKEPIQQPQKRSLEYSTHHIYKKAANKTYTSKVVVWDHEGNSAFRTYKLNVAKLFRESQTKEWKCETK